MTTTKRKLTMLILSIIMTLVLCVGFVPMFSMTAFAAEPLTVTIDTGESVTLNDTNGDGYYEIGTADELYAFAAAVNGGKPSINGKLTANITVNENVLNADGTLNSNGTNFRAWTPIGNSTYMYTGTFDGANNTISGLYYSDSTTYAAGLFGYLYYDNGVGGAVKNVGVVNSYFSGNESVGGVVGKMPYGGTVDNCFSSASVSGTSGIGGVIGMSTDPAGTVRNCYNTGSVSGTGAEVGGVVGSNTGTVENCYNTGSVSSTGSTVGGVVGNLINGGTVKNCYNTGTVSGANAVGGVVGYNHDTVESCYNTGSVSGSYFVGGVVGENYSGCDVKNCYNTGTVSGSNSNVGGVVGLNDSGTITNCYYLKDCATDGSGVAQQGIGAANQGSTTEDVEDGTVTTGYSDFSTGEVAWLLNGKTSDGVWKQTLGDNGDATPNFTGSTVYYGFTSCLEEVKVYTNEVVSDELKHNWVSGKCQDCSTAHTPHTWSDGICSECHLTCEHSAGWTNGVCNECGAAHNPHSYTNGFCTCGGYEPAKKVSDTHHEELNETHSGYYAIENAGQLYWFADYVNTTHPGADAVLTNDIVVNTDIGDSNTARRDWTPIGDVTYTYSGTFDGQGHTISGLYFSNENTDYVGLFGYVQNGTVKNVGVVDSYLCGKEYVGGVVGYCEASYSGSADVENCYNTGTVSGSAYYVGGVVGYCEASYSGSVSVENCYNTGTVSGSAYYVGGVVGYLYSSEEGSTASVKNCYNTGNVSGISSNGSTYVGGVVGQNYGYDSGTATVANCYNTGSVSGSTNSKYVGGVAGDNYASNNGTATIENCYYLTNCATDGDGKTQFGIGAAVRNTATEDDVSGKVTAAKDKDTFKSGAVAYLLNGGKSTGVWKQTLGDNGDASPYFTGKTVYPYGTGYTNHEHNWSYEGSGNQIQATCTAEGCTLTVNYVTITLKAPASLTYDGSAKVVTVEQSPAGVFTDIPDVTYTGDRTNVTANGFTATLTYGEQTAELTCKITTAEVTVTAHSKSKKFGEDNPALTYEVSGLIGGDTLSGALETTATKMSFVGEYDITIGNLANSNYTISYTGAKLSITRAASSVTNAPVAVPDLTYNGGEQDLITAGTADGGTIQYSLDNSTWSPAIPTGTNAGSYTVYYKVVSDINHEDTAVQSVSVTIAKKAVTANDVSLGAPLTYNGGEQTQTVTVAEGITYNVTGNKATNVGDYELTVTGTGNFIGEVKLDWSIKAAAASVTEAPAANTLTYNGGDQALVTAGEADGGKMVYALSENGEYTETIPTGTGAATYTVWYKVVGDSNHSDTEPQSVEVTINKAQLTASISGSVTKPYDGNTSVENATTNTLEIKLDGVLDADKASVFATATYAYDGTDVGTTTIKATDITLSGDKAKNYELIATTASADSGTITKAESTCTPPDDIDTLVFNSSEQALITAGTAIGGEMQYKLGSDGTWGTEIPKGKNAGNYKVFYRVVGDSNHEDDPGGSVVVIIKQAAAPTVTIDKQSFIRTVATWGNTVDIAAMLPDDRGETSCANLDLSGVAGIVSEDLTFLTPSGSLTFGTMTSETAKSGKITLVVIMENYATTTVEVEVELFDPINLTITTQNQNITEGNELDATKFTQTGLVDGHTVTVTVTKANGVVEASGAIIKDADGNDVTTNYTITYTNTGIYHEFANAWSRNDTHHWHACLVDGCTETSAYAACDGGDATCSALAVCSTCGDTYGALDTDDHDFTGYESNNDATCTEDGTKTGKCSRCEATDTVTDEGSMLSHTYGEWTVTKEATETEKGERTKTCACGHTVTEEIPMLEKKGLSGGAIAGIATGSVAVAGLGGFSLFWFVIKKKKWSDLIAIFKK